MDWYRAYHGMPQDAKLKVVAHRTKQPVASVVAVWVYLLDMASQSRPRGNVVIDAEQIAVLQNLETEGVTKIIQGFYEKNLITPENRLTSWDKRQYTTSTERSKKSRSKAQRHATPSNAAQRDATRSDAVQRKNPPDIREQNTDNRKQNTEVRDSEIRSAEVRSAEVRTAEVRSAEIRSAEAKQRKNSDKKLQTHTEKREREREKQKIGGKDFNQNQNGIQNQNETQKKIQQNQSQNELLQQMLGIWNEEVQCKLTRGQQAILTPTRKAQMARRWQEDFQQDMQAWRYYCEIIGASNFCLGRREGKEGKAWTIDLGWAVASSDHVARIMEGGFSGGNHPPRPPSCDVPALQPAWDQVLAAFTRKYGKPAYRSWLAATSITQIIREGGAGAVVTLRCPNRFIQNWIRDHYLADLTRCWQEASAKDAGVIRVELTVEG